MTIAILGAGVGRTGTLSLKLALERLGFGPCYHMKDVFEHLDTAVPLWQRAADGDRGVWDAIFQGYRSAVDFPAASFYRELAGHYPAAKVILTVRDRDRWYKSFSDTISHPLSEPMPDKLADWEKMVHKSILDRVFDRNVEDREHVIASYERHNAAVRRDIAPQRLLVYEVSEGWRPLCKFLGAAVPDEPFPKVNSTAEWHDRIGGMLKRQG